MRWPPPVSLRVSALRLPVGRAISHATLLTREKITKTLMVAIAAFLVALVAYSSSGIAKPVFAASCNIAQGNNGNWFGGRYATPSQANWSSDYRQIRADIESYDPDPVFVDTSIWVMFINSSRSRYYQVGWGKDHNANFENVFSEGYSNSGYFRYFYKSNGTWSTTPPGVNPSGMKEYKLLWADVPGSNAQIQVSYNGGTTQNLTVNWTPPQWDVSAEVHSFQAVPGIDKGDHSPGGTNNKVTVENIEAWAYDGHAYWESPPAFTTPPDEANMVTSSGGGSGGAPDLRRRFLDLQGIHG